MSVYRFGVMVTEVVHYVKEIEIEALDLAAADEAMVSAAMRFDTDTSYPRSIVVAGVDHGPAKEWWYGILPPAECRELWPDTSYEETNPTLLEDRIDWIARLTPERES